MKVFSLLAALAGLTVIALLVAWQDAAAVLGGLKSLGWGVALLPLAWLPNLIVSAVSWCMLFLQDRAPSLVQAMRALWVGQAVGGLLPAIGLGQPLAKVRMLIHDRIPGVDACASVVVDKTVQAVSLIAWGLVGVAVLLGRQAAEGIVTAALIGSALLTAGTVGFVLVQRAGAFGFLARRFLSATRKQGWGDLAVRADEVDGTIRRLYERPGRIVLSCAVRLAARSLMTVELLLAAYLMGHPITIWDAIMLRSLTAALRGAAFMVPGGLGVQEGGYLALGALAGLSPAFSLALALAVRGRELLVNLPGVLAWQHAEGRALLRRFDRSSRR